jgi:4-hydroxybenzoate polyprenyltransferase
MRYNQIPAAERRLKAAWALTILLLLAGIVSSLQQPGSRLALGLPYLTILSLMWAWTLGDKIFVTKAWFGES